MVLGCTGSTTIEVSRPESVTLRVRPLLRKSACVGPRFTQVEPAGRPVRGDFPISRAATFSTYCPYAAVQRPDSQKYGPLRLGNGACASCSWPNRAALSPDIRSGALLPDGEVVER